MHICHYRNKLHFKIDFFKYNVSQFYSFLLYFDQIKAALVGGNNNILNSRVYFEK